MKTINSALREEAAKLKKIVRQAKGRLQTAPEGYLRIVKKGKKTEYYYKSAETNKNGRYMKKGEFEVARRIVQRDYDTQLVKRAEERLKAINIFLEKYEKTNLQEICERMNPYRCKLIQAPIVSDAEYIKQWQAVQYKGKVFDEDVPEIITDRGELVRSKSEKIIADKLHALGIPYRYEYPFILEGGIKMHPDFTILRMPEREEVYLEHLGLMDDNDYVEKTIRKFNTYEKSGIYLGINLFITYETRKYPLNTRTLDGLIKGLFCEETFPFH